MAFDWGSVVSGGFDLAGGLLNRSASKKAIAAQQHSAAQDRELQREFASNAIQWKVADAKAAGIHPLYALGAQTASYTPLNQTFSADHSMGNALSAMGQDLGRAAQSALPTDQKVEVFNDQVRTMSLQKMGLENELLGAQIAKLRSSLSPGIPTTGMPGAIIPGQNVVLPEGKPGERSVVVGGGSKLRTDPGTSDAQVYEDRHGEFMGGLGGAYVLYRDLMHHFLGPQPGFQPQFARASKNPRNSSWSPPVPRWIPRFSYK